MPNSKVKKSDINGCGGKGSRLRPPYRMFFKASCNKHDIGYTIGGDSAKRMECDAKFLAMMLSDSFRIKSILTRTYVQVWAFMYFLTVRIGGQKYFNDFSKEK